MFGDQIELMCMLKLARFYASSVCTTDLGRQVQNALNYVFAAVCVCTGNTLRYGIESSPMGLEKANQVLYTLPLLYITWSALGASMDRSIRQDLCRTRMEGAPRIPQRRLLQTTYMMTPSPALFFPSSSHWPSLQTRELELLCCMPLFFLTYLKRPADFVW